MWQNATKNKSACPRISPRTDPYHSWPAGVYGLTQVKVCAEGGDSGGAFITGAGQGQGLLSGGNYSCKGKQAKLATSYFQPLNPLLQGYGLTLKTSP